MVIMQKSVSRESVQYKRSASVFLFKGSLYRKKMGVTSAYIERATGKSIELAAVHSTQPNFLIAALLWYLSESAPTHRFQHIVVVLWYAHIQLDTTLIRVDHFSRE